MPLIISSFVWKDLSSAESELIANCRLSYIDEDVMKRILVSKQMISNKDEQGFVSDGCG